MSEITASTEMLTHQPSGKFVFGSVWMLNLLVFTSGATSLAIELSASRLLAPYFGTSLFVWANLIGLILLYLTLGYFIGGRVADRYPSFRILYLLTSVAAILTGIIPFASKPILAWSLSAFSSYSIGIFYGSLISVILLFALPMILLGCVSPYAIRLRVEQVGSSGHTAGYLYALSTAGSILGTFLPVLWLIPTFGTYRTFLIFAITLLAVSLLGLLLNLRLGGAVKIHSSLISIFLLVLWVALFLPQGQIKPAYGGGKLIAERESVYNYIQVVQRGDNTDLVLNEGQAIHSIYNPNSLLTAGEWDYFMVAPFFNNTPFSANQVQSLCVIGLGAGTIPRQFTAAYGTIPIDGVELDSQIVNLGREYFHMDEPNLNVIVQDGRYYLQTTGKRYDVIAVDAFQQPYIPFQLTTVEFFRVMRSHLTDSGVAVINAGHTATDYRLVNALAETMRMVFPNVYLIDTSDGGNTLIIGTNAHTSIGNFAVNVKGLTNPLLFGVAQASLARGNMREVSESQAFFTDDKAPVEQLIDQIIFDAVRNNGG